MAFHCSTVPSNLIFVKLVHPSKAEFIGYSAFEGCTSLTNIKFEGTVEQWNAIEKCEDWNYNVPATEVVCSDGVVTLE